MFDPDEIAADEPDAMDMLEDRINDHIEKSWSDPYPEEEEFMDEPEDDPWMEAESWSQWRKRWS